MNQIISIHSYRGGTGKSNTTANVAALMALQGKRIGVVDTDLNSPGVHVPFGLDIEADDMGPTLNDFLWGRCDMVDAAYDVTENLQQVVPGRVFLAPASIKAGEITRLLRDGYDVGLLNDGFDDLLTELELDALLVDTHPGLNNETLLSIAITDKLVIILRPDHQDYQGTAITVRVARKLDVPDLLLVLNKVPAVYDFSDVKARVEDLYEAEVAAMLPHSDEMMTLASEGIFALHYPDNEVTAELNTLANRLLA